MKTSNKIVAIAIACSPAIVLLVNGLAQAIPCNTFTFDQEQNQPCTNGYPAEVWCSHWQNSTDCNNTQQGAEPGAGNSWIRLCTTLGSGPNNDCRSQSPDPNCKRKYGCIWNPGIATCVTGNVISPASWYTQVSVFSASCTPGP